MYSDIIKLQWFWFRGGMKFLHLLIHTVMLHPVWWPGLKNSATVTHACHKRRLKWIPSAWGYSWATLAPGVINTEAWSSRLGVGH
jgi:hypothetical protein